MGIRNLKWNADKKGWSTVTDKPEALPHDNLRQGITCPVELIVAEALDAAGWAYEHERAPEFLDFYVPHLDLFIEVKQFHAERIGKQMARAENVIAIQGRAAARAFAALLRSAAGFSAKP